MEWQRLEGSLLANCIISEADVAADELTANIVDLFDDFALFCVFSPCKTYLDLPWSSMSYLGVFTYLFIII